MTGRGTPSSDPKKKYLGLSAEAWGVIGAVAAVAAVLIALFPHFGTSNGAPGSPNSPSASAQPSGIQASSIPSALPASAQGFSRQWGPGTLLITSNNTDLDSVPPNVNSDGASADMSISGSPYLTGVPSIRPLRAVRLEPACRPLRRPGRHPAPGHLP